MKTEFDIITDDIINNDRFKLLVNEKHHGLSRYEHSIRVAKVAYRLSKKLGINYISATRAALLHDFFLDEDYDGIKGIKKGSIHPTIAAINASKCFDLNDNEIGAIKTHMFPLTLKAPSSKEGLVVTLADKGISLYECSRFKIIMEFSVWMLFIFNIITFKNN